MKLKEAKKLLAQNFIKKRDKRTVLISGVVNIIAGLSDAVIDKVIKIRDKSRLSVDEVRKKALEFYQRVYDFIMLSKEGKLSWYTLFNLASRNLLSSLSRTSVTIGAIASGTAAIVFLVGFAYGLQAIVTDRLIQPNSLQLADVQSSSTALELNKENLEKMAKMSDVEDVSPAMSLAGSLRFDESKTEVVVVGARNSFLDYSHIELLAGEKFSPEAEAAYNGQANDIGELVALSQQGMVAGIATRAAIINNGDVISEKVVNFRVSDDSYVPLRSSPNINAPIVGYVRGSILDTYEGIEVWGSTYESVSVAGRVEQNSIGTWFGKWMKVEKVPVYEESAPTVFIPKSDDSGSQRTSSGYLTQARAVILSEKDAQADELIDAILEEEGFVLGESTDSGEVASDEAAETTEESKSVEVVFNNTQSDSSSSAAQALPEDDTEALRAIVESEQEAAEASQSAASAIVSIPREGGKEILVSTGLLNVWELAPEDVIGKTMTLEFIVSGGLIPGLNGRVVSQPVDYRVAGVFTDDNRSMVYTPLSDIESMGVEKYSTAKVLASEPGLLGAVRERVESLGFTTRSIADTLNQVERLFRVMRFLLGSFGMIAFVVALFGMFNTLTVSLLERTREIGVMKTLGTTDADVMRLMVVEATLIGIVGGVGGILLGMFGAEMIDVALGFFRTDHAALGLFQFPFSFLLLVFALAVVVGMLTGLYPASRAKKISALNALRYE